MLVLSLAAGEEDLISWHQLRQDVERVAPLQLEVQAVLPLDVALVERVVASCVFGPVHGLELSFADEVLLLTLAEGTQHRVRDMTVSLVCIFE